MLTGKSSVALTVQLVLAMGLGLWPALRSDRRPLVSVDTDIIALTPTTAAWTILHVVDPGDWSGAPVIDRLLTAAHPRAVEHAVLLFGRDEILTDRLRARGVRVVRGGERGGSTGLLVVSPDGEVVVARRYRSPLGVSRDNGY